MVGRIELISGSAITLCGVADALIERPWTTLFHRPARWVDEKTERTDLEREIRALPLRTGLSSFLPHFLLVLGPALLANSFIRKRVALIPSLLFAANSLHELAQLSSSHGHSPPFVGSPGDAEWKDVFAGLAGAALAFVISVSLRQPVTSGRTVFGRGFHRVRSCWEHWNRTPDPQRLVNLATVNVMALSAQIYSSPSRGYSLFYNFCNIGVSLIGTLFVFFPLLPLVSLAIKLDSPGPVFFRQTRVGRFGLPFTILKFRNMTMRAAGLPPSFVPPPDEITRVGAFLRRHRIDELPQFLNILRGEMALIGPRPRLPIEMQNCPPVASTLRSSVKPGLTGWAAVNGGRFGDHGRALEYDLYWLAHRRVGLDLEILYRTVRVVLSGQGGG